MEGIGKEIYKSNFEYKVYAVTMRDKASTRISVEIYIVSPEGSMSDLITIQKKDIYIKKNWADVFLGLEADFDRGEIDVIKEKISGLMRRTPETVFQSRETPAGLYRIICSYIRENENCLHPKDGSNVTGIFIVNNYGYIDSYMLDKFVKENRDAGYKRIEILKRLKIMGVLKSSNGRNDVLVSRGGEKRRFYKIFLEEAEEEACEMLDSPAPEAEEKQEEGEEEACEMPDSPAPEPEEKHEGREEE